MRIPKNYVLIDPIDDTEELQLGEFKTTIGKTPDGVKYHEGEFSIRRGYLKQMPNKIEYNEKGVPYHNYTKPIEGNIVYFDYLIARDCDKYKGCFILPYNSLILHLSPDMDTNTIEMLNGYLLASNLPITSSSLDIKSNYEDRFVIKKAGQPNIDYLDGSIDDECIKEGSKVITRFSNYPLLEAQYQNRLDGQECTYFRRRDVIGLLP